MTEKSKVVNTYGHKYYPIGQKFSDKSFLPAVISEVPLANFRELPIPMEYQIRIVTAECLSSSISEIFVICWNRRERTRHFSFHSPGIT